MPNWCTNKVRITGPEEDLAEILSRLLDGRDEAGQIRLLQTFVPMPEKYDGTISGSPNRPADDGLTWYDWQTKNWGVKWGDQRAELECDCTYCLYLRFDTPWGPPVEGLVAFSALYPNIEVFDDWDEESPSKGYLAVKNGEVIEDRSI